MTSGEAGAQAPAVIAVTPEATIRQVAVSAMDNNIYLLTSAQTGDQILIDAAGDMARIGALLRAAGRDAPQTALRAIITTHAHRDHTGALGALATATRATTLAGAADAAAIARLTGVPVKRELRHGDKVKVAGLVLDVIGLRGHTPGSIALAYSQPDLPTRLFTGDSLFPGGVGNTEGDPARFQQLMTDVTARVFEVYDDSAVVHPGHGAPTTLGAERPQLAAWWRRGW
ncbi:MAG: MBL fold metallo-hydrolase [Bifidobacteriaceae bacterium]|jgi:glyoxylase-like metal-dependent hydrolase (beta-lactamase superfamily II)|nr:MBL fold metallo-hydrolase [Bifidobacteriaceae bacterium]